MSQTPTTDSHITNPMRQLGNESGKCVSFSSNIRDSKHKQVIQQKLSLAPQFVCLCPFGDVK